MSKIAMAAILALGLLVGILILQEVGRRLGERHLARDPESARAGTGVVEGAVFALVGLLIAFTFSGAASRFDQRRDLIVQETNAIGTAYLRLDLLPGDARSALQEDFRRYIDARLDAYRQLPDIQAALAGLTKATALQNRIWTQVVSAGQRPDAAPDAIKLLLPALNDMIDITTTRTLAAQMHPPLGIYLMLVALALASALLAGYSMAGGRSRNWLHMVVFAVVMAMTVYIIIDIEFPRLGMIRVDAFDQALVELRATMT
ncbi:hypothetical protein [Thiocystis violascens]|uniref:DUF4239 domain-containing protein n=1 Tax=Thiocystis violascens (strain ATCC 17096 / DSM 198 / 6111) TaxID=765911 RepID=I3Y9K5_THIV6|nr:hypothetical protein [Thiocystis violascens]AFL73673.1 hypothetical protein Thivi_1699 [Thiocystis violascens DSM 198]